MAPSASKTWPKIPKKVVLGISVYPEQITSVGILRRGPVPDNRCPTHQQRALVFRRNMQSHMDDAPTDPVEIQKVSPLPCLVLSRFVLELGDAISGISRVPSQAARSIG